MNIIYYSVNGSVVATAHGDFYMSMYRTAKKCEANEGQVLGLTYKSAEQLIDLDLFRDAVTDGATTTAKAIVKSIRYKHKINAVDIEKEMNKTNNPGLAELLGFVVSNRGGSQNKASIEVENDVIIGIILYALLAVEGAHGYNMECTQMGENGKDDIIIVRKIVTSRGKLDGFISGAKYRFRAQAVYTNTDVSEFTGYVELRIN